MQDGETRILSPDPSVPSWVRAARVHDWAHFLVLPLAGFGGDVVALARGLVIAFCILAFGFLLNGIADRQMDGSSAKNPLVGVRHMAPLLRVVLWLAMVPLALAAFAPRAAAIATGVALASGTLYSIGPRLKRVPLVGTLSNILHFTPLLWVAVADEGPWPGMWTLGCCLALLIVQNQILHEAVDEADDCRGHVLTTWRLMGRRSGAVVVGLIGLALAEVIRQTPTLAAGAPWFALLLGFGLGVTAFVWGDSPDGAARIRLAHRGAAAAAGAWLFLELRVL